MSSKAVKAYLAEIGRKGGKTKGSVKRRSKEHYKRAAEARWGKQK